MPRGPQGVTPGVTAACWRRPSGDAFNGGLTRSNLPTEAIMLQSGDTLQQLIQSLWPESTCTRLPTTHGRGKKSCISTNRLGRAPDHLRPASVVSGSEHAADVAPIGNASVYMITTHAAQ